MDKGQGQVQVQVQVEVEVEVESSRHEQLFSRADETHERLLAMG